MPIPALVYGAIWYGLPMGGAAFVGVRALSEEEEEEDEAGFRLPPHLRCAQARVKKRFFEARSGEACRRWSRIVRSPFGTVDAVAVARFGLPPGSRVAAWMEVSGALRELTANPGLYQSLPLINEHTDAVDRDVDRTFPTCRLFEDGRGAGQTSLSRLLRRFAGYSPDGYCQSMSFVAGFLLLVVNGDQSRQWEDAEETCFFLLNAIVNGSSYNRNYYTDSAESRPGLWQCLQDLRILDGLIQSKLPALHRHLASLRLPCDALCLRWFLCVFVDTVPWQYQLNVMDLYMLRGSPFLVTVAFHVFARMEQRLIECDPGRICTVARDSLRADDNLTPILIKSVASDQALSSGKLAELRRLDEEWMVLVKEQQQLEDSIQREETEERQKIAELLAPSASS
eukprot:TRINITY_DN3137_c3_g1_i1.p1 TRINITY_DN3137_c3_g1~~TRINITY_DN3137_c3_g1_i1.p1  ORF type:complete len:397 (+),score=127.00 TRINITY_DN3137_c3_g1_i1:230-1420(+)